MCHAKQKQIFANRTQLRNNFLLITFNTSYQNYYAKLLHNIICNMTQEYNKE